MRTEVGYIVQTRPLIGTPDQGMRSYYEGDLYPRALPRPQIRECSPASFHVQLAVSGKLRAA